LRNVLVHALGQQQFRTRIDGDNSWVEGAAEERVELRDGAVVIVRPVRPEDRELFVAGFERMSPESRYRRFFMHKQKLTDRELDMFTNLDHEHAEAIGAIDPVTGEGAGVARLHRHEDDPTVAEAAVTVVDDWQGRGLGGVLLDRLVARARELGVERFDASLLTSNRAMLRLFEQLGCMRSHREDDQVLAIDVTLSVAEDEDEALTAALKSVADGSAAVAS
jgi:RimJ/RimL family protein N-acetyltransferase